MDFMECQSCRTLVRFNNTGICLACQRGFLGAPQEDAYSFTETAEEKLKELVTKQKEIEDAIQKSESESLHVCDEAQDGEEMGEGDSERS